MLSNNSNSKCISVHLALKLWVVGEDANLHNKQCSESIHDYLLVFFLI